MKLDSRKLRLIFFGCLGLTGAAFIVVLFFGFSALDHKGKQIVDLKVQSQTAEAQLANLEQAKKQVEAYSYFKDVAKTVIPNDKDQAAAVVEINQMAQQSGIVIQSITFPASSLGLTTAGTATTASQDATSSSSSKAALSQALPVSGIPGLYSLALTITPDNGKDLTPAQQVTYAKMIDFLNRIENNRHTAQISQVSITPAGSGGANTGFSFTLIINIFIKP